MRQVVEESLDVEIDHPIGSPTPFPASPDRVQRVSARPVPIRVAMEHRFHLRLQVHGHHRLRDPVRDRRHPKNPDASSSRLFDLHHPHRRREIAARRTPVGPDLAIGLKDHVLWKYRTTSVRSPGSSRQRRLTTEQTRVTRPLRSTRITRLHRYYETVRPRAPRRYSAPCGVCRLGDSLSPPVQRAGDSVGATGSHVPCKSQDQARAAYTPDAIWAVSRLPPDLSRDPGLAPVSTPLGFVTTGHQRFALARLPDPHLTRSLARLFPQRSPRPALNRRSLRWFGASPCRATPEDLPPSLAQHRIRRSYMPSSFCVRDTRPVETRRCHSSACPHFPSCSSWCGVTMVSARPGSGHASVADAAIPAAASSSFTPDLLGPCSDLDPQPLMTGASSIEVDGIQPIEGGDRVQERSTLKPASFALASSSRTLQLKCLRSAATSS
jgi:hypothetical protein